MPPISREDVEALVAGTTPGPWAVRDQEDGCAYIRVRGTRLGERFKVANALFVPPHAREVEEAVANARMIAAAPTIARAYIALSDENERLREALRSLAEGNLGPAPWQADYLRVQNVARAALNLQSTREQEENHG